MKKIIKYLGLPVVAIGLLWSCEDLDVPITTQLTPEVFPQNSTQFIQTAGPVYIAFRDQFSFNWWWAQEEETGLITETTFRCISMIGHQIIQEVFGDGHLL
jgi:hypothetical protein